MPVSPTANVQRCFREPIAQIFDAARYLDAAVSAHLSGRIRLAEELFSVANDKAVWEWTDSVWGKRSKYVRVVKSTARGAVAERAAGRRPTPEQRAAILVRDKHHCRYCGIPVIRAEVRKAVHRAYPLAVPWGKTNASQHAAFQAMWAQYDHVVPHAHGGRNELDNLVLACAACNFGKMHYALDEVGIADPRLYSANESGWNGLERFLSQVSNPSIERTSSSGLRPLPDAAHVKR
jgi:5-methylcytosine-specific restriction endonuclease McrA